VVSSVVVLTEIVIVATQEHGALYSWLSHASIIILNEGMEAHVDESQEETHAKEWLYHYPEKECRGASYA
jgi:hypothetical protein